MEPEGSLPHSQVPTTCPYPKPARSGPYPHIPFPEDTSLILSSHQRLDLPSALFPPGLHTKTQYTPRLSPIRAKCLPNFILLDFASLSIFGEIINLLIM